MLRLSARRVGLGAAAAAGSSASLGASQRSLHQASIKRTTPAGLRYQTPLAVQPQLHAGLRYFSATPASPSAPSSPSPSSLPSAFRSLLSSFARLGAVPKGWERFFPDGRNPRESNKNEGGEGGNGGAGGGGPKRPPKGGNVPEPHPAWGLLAGGVLLLYLTYRLNSALETELTYQEFKTKFLEQGLVERLEVDPNDKRVRVFLRQAPTKSLASALHIEGEHEQQQYAEGGQGAQAQSPSQTDFHSYYFYIGSVESFERQLEEAQREMGIAPHDYVSVRYKSSGQVWWPLFFQLAFYGGILWWMMRRAGGLSGGMGGMGGKGGKGPFSFGKSPATLIQPGDSKVAFKDVAGLDEAKVEVMEFVKFLQNPDKFTKLGAKLPKGALLCGPPGTGKTLLAKAVAGEAQVPFFSIDGSSFLEMFVGVGPSRVRDLFAQARANTPCIIFIDEIDAVGRARSKSGYGGGNDERENTLNQLLVEMDGMSSSEGVVVLAGTNRKDMLDKALLRPGRFDRHITIDKPDIKGRAQIFMVHLAKLTLDPRHTREDIAQRLAALTPGFAGADIANLCNEAALIAARADKSSVHLIDFELATDRVIGGLEKKSSVMNLEEKKLVAHHEAGHAVAAWFLEHADPLLKVTIVPRASGALGFAQYLPKELTLYHQQQLLDMMAMALGGRAAEEIFFGRVSTGASDDLQKVTRIAQAQVTTYGMSEKLGHVSYAGGQEENQFQKPFSEATAQMIDEEVRKLVSATYQRTLELLRKHKEQVAALANKLIETENVNHDVLLEVLGPRPFQNDAYLTWRRQSQEAAEEARQAAEAKKQAEEAAAAEGAGLSPA